MNCKKGDLAVVVYSTDEGNSVLLGKVVTVIECSKHPDAGHAVWTYEGVPLRDGYGRKVIALSDHYLRPIRDQPGADETLTSAGKPAAKDLVRA